jgi:hypothetical protein
MDLKRGVKSYMIPRRFYYKKFDEWQVGGYKMIDFSKSTVDLSSMPDYYQDKFSLITRKVEKNYFLNHLVYHELAQIEHVDNTYYFRPDFISQLHIAQSDDYKGNLSFQAI